MNFLYILENIRNPVLDVVMTVVTYLGSEVAFLVFALAVYWCVGKRHGYYLLTVGYIGVIINQILKLVFMIQRPWVRDPSFTAVESAKADATGFSFPSGHTQNATGTYLGIAIFSKKKWIRVTMAVFIVLTAFSRMYLGVHTPLDVGVSLILGVVLAVALYKLYGLTEKYPKLLTYMLASFTLISVGFLVFTYLRPVPEGISAVDYENFREARKTAYTLLGATSGVFVFHFVEEKFIRFDTRASLPVQALKLVCGMATVLAVKELPKLICGLFIENFTEPYPMRMVRYFAVVAAAVLYPVTFKYFARLDAKIAEKRKARKGAAE